MIPVHLKINIFKTAELTIYTYGCESWIIRPSDENSINAFATSCFRIILGIKRLDRVTNAEVYRRSAQTPLIATIRARQLRWVGHLLRRDKNEPAHELALYEPPINLGVTKRGKPNITYKHQIASMLPKLLGTKSKPELMATEMIED